MRCLQDIDQKLLKVTSCVALFDIGAVGSEWGSQQFAPPVASVGAVYSIDTRTTSMMMMVQSFVEIGVPYPSDFHLNHQSVYAAGVLCSFDDVMLAHYASY